MFIIRVVLVGILCVAAAGARAQSFEQQLFQISQDASAIARQTRVTPSAQPPAVQAPAAWQKVTGPDGTFTIEMPAAPQYTATPVARTATHAAFTLHQYVCIVEAPQRLFLVTTSISPDADAEIPLKNLQAAVDTRATIMDGGRWISVTSMKHQGLPAIEAIGLSKGIAYRQLWVVRGRQEVTTTYGGPDGTVRSEDANRFFASLNIR